jgi:hypothetical protein
MHTYKKDGNVSYVMVDGKAVPINNVTVDMTDDALAAIAAAACMDRRPGDRPTASLYARCFIL